MSKILIVDDEAKLSHRVWPASRVQLEGASAKRNVSPEITTWREFTALDFTGGESKIDIVVLNLDAPDAPNLREALRLREKQPNLGFFYIMEIPNRKLPERTITALSEPGVIWGNSKASDEELQLRLLGLVSSIKRLRQQSRTKNDRSPWEQLMPALHNPESGRLDAARTAEWFGMPVKTIASLLGRRYATVHKTPDAAAHQDMLKVFLRIASALTRMAGSHENAKIWLNSPCPDLEDNQTPLSAIEMGEQEIIAELLEDGLVGQPG